MKRALAIASGLILTCCATPSAQAERGDWELTLAGTGTSNKDFDEHAIGLNVSVGYFLLDDLELSVRQLGIYVKEGDSSAGNGATTFALDWHFPLGEDRRWQPFIGANLGFYYGDTFTDTFEYAPEAGVKYFINRTTFLYGRVEYQIFSDNLGGSGDSADRQFVYSVGIGFRF